MKCDACGTTNSVTYKFVHPGSKENTFILRTTESRLLPNGRSQQRSPDADPCDGPPSGRQGINLPPRVDGAAPAWRHVAQPCGRDAPAMPLLSPESRVPPHPPPLLHQSSLAGREVSCPQNLPLGVRARVQKSERGHSAFELVLLGVNKYLSVLIL